MKNKIGSVKVQKQEDRSVDTGSANAEGDSMGTTEIDYSQKEKVGTRNRAFKE